MKHNLFLLPLAALLCGCQSDETPSGQTADTTPVEIRLSTALIQTRSAVNSTAEGNFSADGLGIFMLAEGVAAWSDADQTTGLNNVNTRVSDGNIAWTDGNARYYPSTSYQYGFYGYYPIGTPTYADGKYTVAYTLDGTQDIFAGTSTAAVYNASYFKIDGHSQSLPELHFEHKLTQLNFQITPTADEGSSPATYHNVNNLRVQSIAVTNVPTAAVLTVADINGADAVLSVSGSETVWVKKSDTQPLVAAENDLTVIGSPVAHQIGQPLLVPALASDNTSQVVITFQYGDDAANTIQRSVNLTSHAFVAGSSYTLTLTVGGSNQEITLKAVLTPWTNGGSVDLGGFTL